jgi:DNA-directed RNA polymerase specialized sigma24 family protein
MILALHRVSSRAVFDPNSPSSKRIFAELQNPQVRSSLLRYAAWRTDSQADAEDLLADAIERVCDPDRKPWDPAKASFFRHIRLVMDDIATVRARGGRARFEVVDSKLAHDEAMGDRAPLPDGALHEHRQLAWLRRLESILLGQVEGKDPIAASLLRAAQDGIEEPAEQAATIGCRVEEVYEALRRLKYRGARIKAEEEQAEAQRMKETRERTKKEPGK